MVSAVDALSRRAPTPSPVTCSSSTTSRRWWWPATPPPPPPSTRYANATRSSPWWAWNRPRFRGGPPARQAASASSVRAGTLTSAKFAWLQASLGGSGVSSCQPCDGLGPRHRTQHRRAPSRHADCYRNRSNLVHATRALMGNLVQKMVKSIPGAGLHSTMCSCRTNCAAC